MHLNLPNTLTLFRIFLVPLLVVVLLTPPWTTAWIKEQVQEWATLQGMVHLSAWLSRCGPYWGTSVSGSL